MSERQLALALPVRPALRREDFLVTGANADAVAWLDRWPDWPAPALALYGPAGCGKSHLAEVWRARSGAGLLRAADLIDADLLALAARPQVVEDVDGGVDERKLLHLYNMLAERGGSLLLTGSLPPARWRIGLADLRSRLNAVPAVRLGPPDDPLIAAVLVKLFADRQIKVGEEVIGFLLGRMERSFAAARGLVAALDSAALAEGRPVTVPLARRILQDGTNDYTGETSWISE